MRRVAQWAPSPFVSRQYTAEEMEAIVRRALERRASEEGFARDEVIRAAEEIGLPVDEVEAAAAEVELERDRRRWEEAARKRRRRKLWGRVTGLVGLNGLLFVIDALTGTGWWVHWVLIGTAVPVSVRALRLFRPVDERELEREQRREERTQRRRARALRRRQRGRSPAEEFEIVVERGVELLHDAIARRAGEPSKGPERPREAPRVRVETDEREGAGEEPERARKAES